MAPLPAQRGYRMPAEWARHRGTWLSWPHREASWPGKFEPVPGVFAEMVRTRAPRGGAHQRRRPAMDEDVRARLASCVKPMVTAGSDSLYLHHIPTDDAWCRDHGPIFVQRDRTACASR